jgi:hypothetical protein
MPGFLGITSIAMIHHGKSSKIQGVDVLRARETVEKALVHRFDYFYI